MTITGGWTEATEQSFLAALRDTGEVASAARAIGRVPGACYYRRDRRPAFAAAWAAALADHEQAKLAQAARAPSGSVEILPAEGADGQPWRRYRRNGWNPRKQDAFLETLRAVGSITDAARAVGMSPKSVYDRCEQDGGFHRACDAAFEAIRPSLLETAYQRAVNGVEEPVFHAGQLVGTKRKYSDAMLRLLIDRGFDPRRSITQEEVIRVEGLTQEEVDAALMKRLEALAQSLKRRARQEQLEWAERMEKAGWAP